MKKNSIDKILNPVIILIYIVALATVTYFHEPWFDEVQAYLIARDASIMDIMFRIPHYEAHPALWHLYLVPFAKSNIPFELGLKSASIIINAIAISLFIYKAPFRRAIRYTLPFTYYFFYLYGVVARCYSITMLAFVLMAISYKSRNAKPIFYVLSMALLCLSSIYGVVFAGGLCIVWLLEIIGEKGLLGLTKSLLKDKRTLWMFGLLFVAVLLIYLIFPSKDAIATYYPKSQPLVYRLFYMFILAPTEAVFAHHFTGEYHIFKGEIPLYTAIIGIAVFAIYTLAVYIVSKSKGKLKETIIPYVLFSLFAGTMYFSEHHIPVISYFSLYIAWICFEESYPITIPNWLTKSSPDKQKAEMMIKKSLGVFAAICILIPIYWNVNVIINDVRYPYDSKREIAEFIKENNLENANIMAAFRTLEDGTETEHDCLNIQRDATVNAYFDSNIIYSLNDGKAGYIQHFMADQEYINQTLAKWRKIGAPDVLIGNVDLEYIFEGEITMHDYTPVLVAYQQIFVKNDSVRLWSAVRVYVRNDLLDEYGLIEIENTSSQSQDNTNEAPVNYSSDSQDNRSFSFSLNQPRPIEQVINDSYFILRCEMISIDYVDEQLGYSVYTFEYVDAIKGYYDDKSISVNVFDFDVLNRDRESVILKGNEYILCLEKTDSIFKGAMYTLCSGLCMEVDDNLISQVYQRGKSIDSDFSTIDELTRKVSGIVKNPETNNEESVVSVSYTLSSDPAEIINFSTYIVKAKAVEKTTSNHSIENADQIRFEVIEEYKGSIQDSIYVAVFRDSVVVGEEYLLMLESSGGNAYVISSNNSCIPVKDEKLYDEYMEYIN